MRTYALRKNLIILYGLMMMVILTGCSNARYDTKESTKILLPTLVQYDGKIQDEAIKEVKGGQCKAHVEFAKDYIQLRDRLRLVKEELK